MAKSGITAKQRAARIRNMAVARAALAKSQKKSGKFNKKKYMKSLKGVTSLRKKQGW